MNKNEILQMSRKENEGQDEMEKRVTVEGEAFSLSLTLAMGLLLYVCNRIRDLPSDTIFIMLWTSFFSSRLYRLTRRRSTSDLITMLISFALLIFYLVKYLIL